MLTKLLTFLILFSVIIALSSCDNNDDDMEPGLEGNVSLSSNSSLGEFLVDGNGMTLYFFSRDVDGQSSCVDASCLNNWPVFYSDNLNPGAGLNAADFGSITRPDGEMQTTYKGWPLYYFAGDAAEGDVNGEAVNNVWFVAKPDYSLMIAMGQLVGADGKNYTSDYSEGEGITMYFTDINGRTLYIFINDEENTNNFTNSDFSNNASWPIFHVEIQDLPSILDESDFGVIDVFGRSQLTFRGWPLYYFGSDAERGETKGVSVPSPGIWPIVNNDTSPAQ